MYKEYKQLNLTEIGKEVLEFWKDKNIFNKSIQSRDSSNSYTFYEGPPSANGMPGIHHVMARTIKDIFCRYKTLKGFQVKRKGGWDTHGLPIELAVEKSLGITKEDIGKKISVEAYNDACKKEVLKYTDVWNDLTEKMGYWVDLQNPYITYKNDYIESLWWILSELYKKDFLYKGYTVQPYSPAAGTGLSSHELNQPGTYRDVKDTSIVAQFKLRKNEHHPIFANLFDHVNEEVFILAWTTTPWTLPSNCALAIAKEVVYVKIKTFNQYTNLPISVILAQDLVHKYFNKDNENASIDAYTPGNKNIPWTVTQVFKGSDLIDLKYEQLLPYVTNESLEQNAFRVIAGDFVTTDDGTGIVHIASVFGADDFRAAKEAGVPSVLIYDTNGNSSPLVDKQGKFVNEVTDFAGKYVKEEYYSEEERNSKDFKPTDVLIAIKLKEENRAFDVKKYEHSYPHCWRTDKPILYYPLDSWFIRTTKVKDKLVALNKTINWKPESTGTGRFGNWLENLVDWNLSRSRYWGTPLPIWGTNGWNNEFERQWICLSSLSQLLNMDDYGNEIANPNYKIKFKSYIPKLVELLDSFKDNSISLKSMFRNENDFKKMQTLVKQDVFKTENYFQIFKFQLLKKENINDFIAEFATDVPSDIELHRPYVDNVFIVQRTYLITHIESETVYSEPLSTNIYTREPDLIDVWFDSGAMPYAQWHFPFENKQEFASAYPADFIAEGVDQTRGWFFTLHAIAALLDETSDEVKEINKKNNNGGIAFKNVISNGLVLDKNGNKMSKRLGNAVDPFSTIEQYSADATRWYMISNASPWDNLKFNIEGLDEVRRKFFGTLYNTYAFFVLYANIDQFTYSEEEIDILNRPELDRWIISLLNSLIKEVDDAYKDFEPTKAARSIQTFVDEHLSNWYVRLSRRRFWKGDYTHDKISAYQTLYSCLITVSKLMSPIAPFFSDKLYYDLNSVTKKENFESIHLSYFPNSDSYLVDLELEERMQIAQDISSMVLSLRKKVSINVRQPLQKILIPVLDSKLQKQIEGVKDLILSETNVKDLEFIADTTGFITKKIKPNFKALGKKVGKDMKLVSEAISKFTQKEISILSNNGEIAIENTAYIINLSDVEIFAEDVAGWQVANLGPLTVALDIHISDVLLNEGLARELVNRIQLIRKEMGLEVTDNINVKLQNHSFIAKAVENNLLYICAETLTSNFSIVDHLVATNTIEIQEIKIDIDIQKHH